MAFTSFDQLATGATPLITVTKTRTAQDTAPVLTSSFLMAGTPLPVVPALGMTGAALAYTGAHGELPLTGAAPGLGNKLIGVLASEPSAYNYVLCDRLWHNGGINVTTTTEQLVSSVTLPPRDVNGSTQGEGVWAALEFSTGATNAAPVANCTLRFTNSSGAPNQVGTPLTAIPTTANAHSFIIFGMPTTSTGVRSIEGITLGTSLVSGTVRLVMFRPLVDFSTVGSPGGIRRFSALALNAPTITDDSVLFVLDSNTVPLSTALQITFRFAGA